MATMSSTTKQAAGSYMFEGEDALAHHASMLESVTATSCLCGASFQGTATAGMEWHREHRATEHPGWVDRGQRARAAAAKKAPVTYWHTRNANGFDQ
jgi:hypothetical protein